MRRRLRQRFRDVFPAVISRQSTKVNRTDDDTAIGCVRTVDYIRATQDGRSIIRGGKGNVSVFGRNLYFENSRKKPAEISIPKTNDKENLLMAIWKDLRFFKLSISIIINEKKRIIMAPLKILIYY